MDNANAINAQLYRKIKSGKQYDKYMPYSDCSSIKLAEGDTKEAIEQMAFWSVKYQHHTQKLAELFKHNDLETLCSEIHTFLYNHFQYKIDGYEQNLRSPACSWNSRKLGIDCKSYSIFASTLLSNLGIHHFLRRITQAPNEGFSHVYLTIPENQKKPTESTSYFTIDGTVPFKSEPNFYKKDDVFMEAKLPIYGLAGVKTKDAIDSGMAQLVSLAFQGLLNELVGCGDAKYSFPVVKMRVERDLQAELLHKMADLEKAISWGNRPRIQHLFNEIFKELDLGIAHLRSETAYAQQDECIAKTLSVTLKYVEKIKAYFEAFYTNFKNNFSLYEIEEFYKDSSTSERSMYFVVGQADNPIYAEHRYIVLRRPEVKFNIDPIYPFEENHHKWLANNINRLKQVYSDGREIQYKKEVTPLLNKVLALREKYYLGGEALYLFEQPLQREMYKLWLKYDDKYKDYLKQESQDLLIANRLAVKDFEKRLKKEIETDRAIKRRQKLTKIAGYSALACIGLIVIKKSNNNVDTST